MRSQVLARTALSTGAFCLSVLAGCTAVGPDYTAPTSGAPSATFVNGGSAPLVAAARIAWWRELGDPQLTAYVARGLKQNLDLAASLRRIEAAQAVRRTRGFNAQIDGSVSASETRIDNGLFIDDVEKASADASYVFDLFGGFRRSVEEAEAGIGQALFRSEVVKLGFLGELVSAYIDARYYQNALEITRQVLQSRRRTLELVQIRFDAGGATQLELEQATQVVERTKATLPILNASFESSVFRMATLLAEPAGPLLAQMQRGARMPTPGALGRIGVPADLLRNRPDVRLAERALAAATARIGVAEAQLYPSLVLAGTITGAATRTWAFGPTISLPVLNRGALAANRDAAIAEARATAIDWRSTVFQATEDVQVALTRTTGFRRETTALTRVRNSAQRLLELSRISYQDGASPLTDVLDAEIAVSDARFSLLDSRRNAALGWVQLQLATGKGWLAE